MDWIRQTYKQCINPRREFSVISGYNYYALPEVIPENGSFLAMHVPSGVEYRLDPGPVLNSWEAEEQIKWYRDFVLKPAPRSRIEWPVDLVRISSGSGSAKRERLYYVFLQKHMPKLEPIKWFLYLDQKHEHLDWRQEPVQKVAVGFLETMADLHDSGYTYNDFNLDRICHDPATGRVFLRYTGAVRRKGNGYARNAVDPTQVAVEFAPPCGGIDRDRYAIAAILFRLMIGRLPYQGWQIEQNTHVFDRNYPDLEQELAYQAYFKRYHSMRCFIFDPEDDSNCLSPGVEEDQARARWKALPNRVKNMFIQALAYTDPEKQEKMVLYTPQQWLAALKLCWKKQEGGREND